MVPDTPAPAPERRSVRPRGAPPDPAATEEPRDEPPDDPAGPWRTRPVAQRPDRPGPDHLRRAVDELATLPPLVFAPRCRPTERRGDVEPPGHRGDAVNRALGTRPGGVDVELTGDDVTKCVGGGGHLPEDDLHQRYATVRDPRLGRGRSLDLTFAVADMDRYAT